MATIGKKVSSTAAVACVWVGGSALAQLVYIGVMFALAGKAGESSGLNPLWVGVFTPVVAAFGGTAAVAILRVASGWPKLPVVGLFLRALCVGVFALVLLPTKDVALIGLVAWVLALGGAMMATWRQATRGSLGTRLFAGSTKAGEKEKGASDAR